ncbi:hypothetical protein FA13DRAFT_1711813 [Coprinellus micaceus]|uniref:Uncharacterized protein n=1 Tax=Coprinellus micaceus TaxID=71717 RepID=A0A4Y7T323_COPMI|nr:hypothetical protein FA13DRAFT_1711813 [Coprinellus micaceus]
MKFLASAGNSFWQNVKTGLSSAPTSPVSAQNSNMGSPMAVDAKAVLESADHECTTIEDVPEDDDSSSDGGKDDNEEDTEMREQIHKQERENEYREADEENNEIHKLVEEVFERSISDLHEFLEDKLTEEQIRLPHSFVVGEGGVCGDVSSEADDRWCLEFEQRLAAIVFALKIEDKLTEATFNKFQYVFPESHTESYKMAKARIVLLTFIFDINYPASGATPTSG